MAGFGIAMPNSPPQHQLLLGADLCGPGVGLHLAYPLGLPEIRSVGASQSASAYAGISYPKVVILAMVISRHAGGLLRPQRAAG